MKAWSEEAGIFFLFFVFLGDFKNRAEVTGQGNWQEEVQQQQTTLFEKVALVK